MAKVTLEIFDRPDNKAEPVGMIMTCDPPFKLADRKTMTQAQAFAAIMMNNALNRAKSITVNNAKGGKPKKIK